MEGYGYGIWLVYEQDIFNTPHLGHFTIVCLMEDLDEATQLFNEIINKFGNSLTIHIDKKYKIYETNIYENDTNDILSWGYNGTCDKWNDLKLTCNPYKCSFSEEPHTSIQYSKNPNLLRPYNYNENSTAIKCNIHLVNIKSSLPSDWHIII